MRTGKDRVQLESINQLIEVGNARVAPGCLMRGDSDGVIAIPVAHEDEVLDLAEDIQSAEERIREAVMTGVRLDEARRQHRYHHLQRRQK
jgi:regulator of RNase E activity RraA